MLFRQFNLFLCLPSWCHHLYFRPKFKQFTRSKWDLQCRMLSDMQKNELFSYTTVSTAESFCCSNVWQVHLMSGKTTHQYPHLKEWKLHFMDIYVRNVDQNPLKRIHSGNFTFVTLLLTGMWQRMQIKTQRNDVSTFLNEQLHCFEDQIQRNNTGSRKYISFLVVKGKTDLSVYNIQRK